MLAPYFFGHLIIIDYPFHILTSELSGLMNYTFQIEINSTNVSRIIMKYWIIRYLYYLNTFQTTILVAQLLDLKAILQVNTEIMGMPSVYLGDFKIYPNSYDKYASYNRTIHRLSTHISNLLTVEIDWKRDVVNLSMCRAFP